MDSRAHGQRKGPYSPDICPSDFFLFGWSKEKLQQRQFRDPEQLFEAVDEFFGSFSVDMIEDVFRNRLDRLYKLSHQMVTTFSKHSLILPTLIWDGPKVMSGKTPAH
jgi:uncharacterized membrane protein YsdA (DUF1294 family)